MEQIQISWEIIIGFATLIGTWTTVALLKEQVTAQNKANKLQEVANKIAEKTLIIEQAKAEPNPNLVVTNIPDYWHKYDQNRDDYNNKVTITIANLGNTDCIVESLIINSKTIKNTGQSGYIASFLPPILQRKIIKQNETKDIEINTFDFPKHQPLFFELRFKSSHDNYKQLIFKNFDDNEDTRTIK
jgi:hypothetical protein